MPEGLYKKPMVIGGLEETKFLWRLNDPAANRKALKYAAEFYSKIEPEIELLGAGSEHIVTSNPGDPGKVVAYEHTLHSEEEEEYPLQRHEQYQIQKLFHCLFPHNFPDIYAAISGTEPHFVRQRIRPQGGGSYEDFNAVIDASRKLGLVLEIDPNPENFLRAENGDVYYVDNILTPNNRDFLGGHLDQQALKDFYAANDISLKEQKIIQKCLDRLKEYRIIKSVFETFTDAGTADDRLRKAIQNEGLDLRSKHARILVYRVQQFIQKIKKYQAAQKLCED